MATATPTTTALALIAAGIDLGSRNARIAIIPKSEQSQSSPTPTIVPNEIGQRFTLALSLTEPKTEADPLNDQYWDKPKKKQNKQEKEDEEGLKGPTFIYGEAARRTLHRLKKPLHPHFVFQTIATSTSTSTSASASTLVSTSNDEKKSEENEEETNNEQLQAAQAFFSHLSTQATNANGTTAHPSSLRYVLSIPPSSLLKSQVEVYIQTVEKGMLQSMRQVGYDTAPAIINSNKKEKKKIIKNLENNQRVLAVITNPVAIGHAHGLFDHDATTATTTMPTATNDNDDTPSANGTTTTTSNHNSIPNKNWKNILIVDWGASSLTLTHLSKNLGSTNLTSLQKTQSESKSCSGINILNILVSHAAEIFERNKRGMIPRGETLLNKKAKAKLEVACEDALRSFGYTPKAHVTIDGLIDGIDCQVEIMLARFEMLLAGTLRMAEGMIRDFVTKSGVEFDGVLSAGGIMRMSCVDSIMKRLFQGKWRGKGVGDVAPEEAIAMGCASFAHALLESSPDSKEGGEDMVVEEDVLLSPVGIGLSLQEGDPAAIVMIEKRTPLPALVTKIVQLADSSTALRIIQISEEAEKIVGKIEGIDTAASSLEITMELSCTGQLSVLINGGSPIVI